MTAVSTMNKCPDCNAILLRPTSCESCGWPKVRPKHAERPAFTSTPQLEVSRAVGAMEAKVNAFVSQYRKENPDASMRDASLEFMRQHNLTQMLPSHIKRKVAPDKPTVSFEDAMDDYREELANVG